MQAVGRAGVVALVIGLCVGAGAQAQTAVRTEASSAQAAPQEWLQLRLRAGLSLRSGSQTDPGPGLSYQGSTPNDLALLAWWWVAANQHLGLVAAVHREGFGLYDNDVRVMQGGLLRASAGATWRFVLGPVRLEPQVAYAFHQLPSFGSTTAPTFGLVQRHGVLLAARGLVDVGPVTVELRGEFPVQLAAAAGTTSATTSGYGFGGALRLQLFSTASLHWGLLADFSYHADTVALGSDTRVSQAVSRVGGALDIRLRDEPPPAPRFGGLVVTVVDADSSMPLSGVQAVAVQGSDIRPLAADANGALGVQDLLAGAVAVKASLGGYEPGELLGTVTAGQDTPLVLKLTKEKPKVGSVKVTVVLHEAGTPLAGAAVQVGDTTLTTDAAGVVTVGELPPGPVAVKVALSTFTPGEEAVSIAAGRETELTVTLVPEKKRLPATISGHVRSKRGGAPVAAHLEIPEAKIITRAGADGAFSLQVEGGTYTVRIYSKGFFGQKKRVTVKDGDKAIFNVDLSPK